MALISLACPQCGANLEVVEGQEFYFCQYCGAKVTHEKKRVELSGAVTVSNVANSESLLKRAYMFVEDKNFDDAVKYFDRVLDIDPECSKAYIGFLLCRLGITNIDILVKNSPIPLESHEEFNKALKFARGKELQEYEAMRKLVSDRYLDKKKATSAELKSIINSITNTDNAMSDNRASINRLSSKQVTCTIFGVLCLFISIVVLFALPTALSSVETNAISVVSGILTSAIMLPPPIIGCIALFRLAASARRQSEQLIRANRSLSTQLIAYNRRREELAAWMQTFGLHH